ncbi:RNA/RNP complex-1-interacting phosphatase-like [Polistes fuscatus]|uniref:RNA/RNP complex-1-interacting phosphatase-like n=1 Tax=Polistes fuscatus TaxID=30207 RepID=UPI001CA8EF28|nr:RNA/RNP complex-1-interacting phosphatase-like [Polistes fuscatus]
MGRSVPEGWLEYKPYGDVIKGTKILPFKVPLKETIAQNVKPEERFTASMILEAYPRLKFIVDLTNTERYYDKTEFTRAGVKHTKISIPGKKIPPLHCVIKFFETMDNFMAAAEEDDVIGVHCTHGINRTGYLICRYLIEKRGWESQDSLQAFEEARGYPIYRDEYIAALKKVSLGETKDTNKAGLTRPNNTRKDNNPTPVRKVLDQYRLRVKHPKGRPVPYPMGPPPGYKPHRRGFTNGAPYLPQPFGFGAPPHGFGSMPPHPPGMPPPPPGPPMYCPRPLRFGPPLPPPPPAAMRAPMPPLPPGPDFRRSVVNSGFHPPAFPNRLPGPSRMSGPPRLPPGPQSRLPPPKMPPPPPPPPPQVRQVSVKRLQANKKKHQHQQSQIRNGMAVLPRSSMRLTRREVSTTRRIRNVSTKMIKEQDFTADTFEENLLAVSSTNSHLRRSTTKGRYHQTK